MNDEQWENLRAPIGAFDRLIVLDEVASTQDVARQEARGRPGVVVVGRRQVGGRGRQGRAWQDAQGLSLSMSMVARSGLPPAGLSLASGLAVIDACVELGAQGLGLKWPNDVVERTDGGRGRKLAGVLIEASDGLAIVGVGLNVKQQDTDWPADLAATAVSLRQLGLRTDRPAAARAVLEHLSGWLEAPAEAVREQWVRAGTLRGQHCAFTVEGREVAGVVVDLDAQWRLVLERDWGARVRIDAAHAHLEYVRQTGSSATTNG